MSERGFLSRKENNDAVQHYRRPVHHSTYRDPDDAPLNKPWRCQARDGSDYYVLPMLCIRTETGWVNARTKTPLHVTVTGWKYP